MKKRIFIVLLLCALGFYFIPSLVHGIYRLNTDDDKIMVNRKLYNSLSQDSNQSEMDSLYLWFHVRGLPIDEDHNGISKYQEWSEIITFWKGGNDTSHQ